MTSLSAFADFNNIADAPAADSVPQINLSTTNPERFLNAAGDRPSVMGVSAAKRLTGLII